VRLGAFALALALAACAGKTEPSRAPRADLPALHLSPIEDVVPAPGLEWLIVARPRAIAERPELIPAIRSVVSEEKFDALAKRNGGIDLRTAEELAVAHYTDATLVLARTLVDPARLERAFGERVPTLEGRAVDKRSREPVVREWGEGPNGREQLAIFGTAAVGHERGKLGPLRAAQLFAEARLKRAQPALRSAALAGAAQIAKDAPFRFFAPGPFVGDTAKGLGGLLAATTCALVAAAPAPNAAKDGPGGPVTVTIALVGAWTDDASAARERLAAAWNTLASSSLGRLSGVDKPLVAPVTRLERDAIVLEVTVDALSLGRGIHYAVDAPLDEVMREAGR
jgi:hypothetical protein